MMATKLTKFTLDTNCLIAVDDSRPEKDAVLGLLGAAKDGRADVAMVASSASERQVGGGHLTNIGEFRVRLEAMGFGHIELLKPIGTFSVSFYGFAVMPSQQQRKLQSDLFAALFPSVEQTWSERAAALGVDVADFTSPEGWKWRNRLLDVQAVWAHVNYGRDIFVTSDKNFSKRLTTDPQFSDLVIATPQEAVAIL
jgi:hypothetical protein